MTGWSEPNELGGGQCPLQTFRRGIDMLLLLAPYPTKLSDLPMTLLMTRQRLSTQLFMFV